MEIIYDQLGRVLDVATRDLKCSNRSIADTALATLITLASGCHPDTVLSTTNGDVDFDQGVITLHDSDTGLDHSWYFGGSKLMERELSWRIGVTDDPLLICSMSMLDLYASYCLDMDDFVSAEVLWHLHNALIDQNNRDNASLVRSYFSASGTVPCDRGIPQ